jgi:hypothetical protein
MHAPNRFLLVAQWERGADLRVPVRQRDHWNAELRNAELHGP